jgi:CBS domain-containing protein
MTAKDLMNPEFLTIHPETSVLAIMQMFRDSALEGFPVLNENRVVMGLVGKDDLFTKDLGIHIPTYLQLLEEAKFAKRSQKELPYAAQQILQTQASDVMDQAVFYAKEDTPVEVVAAFLANDNQGVVPVVDADNKFLGAIDQSSILKLFAGDVKPPVVDTVEHVRPVDSELKFVQRDISSRFSYIAQTRANLWLSTTIILFVIGFGLGIIFIVDPQPIVSSVDANMQQLLDVIFNR